MAVFPKSPNFWSHGSDQSVHFVNGILNGRLKWQMGNKRLNQKMQSNKTSAERTCMLYNNCNGKLKFMELEVSEL